MINGNPPARLRDYPIGCRVVLPSGRRGTVIRHRDFGDGERVDVQIDDGGGEVSLVLRLLRYEPDTQH